MNQGSTAVSVSTHHRSPATHVHEREDTQHSFMGHVLYSPLVLRRSNVPLSTLKFANCTRCPNISTLSKFTSPQREIYVQTASIPSFPSLLPSALPTALLLLVRLSGSYMDVPGTSPAISSRVLLFVSGTNRVVKIPQNMKRA